MAILLPMPKLGESVVEGTVIRWLVREGDIVAREQAVCEVATDKADAEVPANSAGRITRIAAPENTVVKVGETLCEIDETAAGQPTTQAAKPTLLNAGPAAAPHVGRSARSSDL